MDELREKLVAILADYFNIGDSYHYILGRVKEAFAIGSMRLNDFREYDEDDVAEIADHLIDNGVTVQRHIPVSERVPTEADVKHSNEMVLAYSTIYKSWQREHFTFVVNHPNWYTHWMPLPEPPKEVQK